MSEREFQLVLIFIIATVLIIVVSIIITRTTRKNKFIPFCPKDGSYLIKTDLGGYRCPYCKQFYKDEEL